jgi:opacity protein-like surface antigen
MKRLVPTAAMLAVAAAFPAAAQSNEELLKELRALRERVNQLEQKLQQPAAPAATPATAPAGQWGMTPEQARELNRVTVKTEAIQDNFESQGFKGLKISGQMDPSYIYNKRQDSSSFVFLNGTNPAADPTAYPRYTYDNSYFGMVVLDIAKETESGTLWRLTLAPERGTGALINSGSIVHEASVSIPLTDLQTRLWIGQIPDWTGYELTLPAGNKLITHNLLFDFVTPTAYTGAVLDVKSGKWWMRGGLANVNSVRNGSGNKAPSLIYRVDYSKGEFNGFGFSGVHGKLANFAADGSWMRDTGQVDANGDPILEETFFAEAGKNTMANLFEVDAYFIRGDWSLFGQASYGTQKQAAIYNSDGMLRDAKWWGVSGLVAYKITPRFETTLRLDYISNTSNGGGMLGYSYDDSINGIGRAYALDASGAPVLGGDAAKGSNRYALSLGTSYRVDENSTFKLEYRYDTASQTVFGVQNGSTTTGFAKTNHLFGASMVVSF